MRKQILWALLDSIFVVVFNLVFFVMTESPRITAVWVSYGFIHFAYASLLLTAFLIRSGKSAAVFGMSLYGLSSAYFLIELCMGVVFVATAYDNVKIVILIQAILAALYAILMLSHLIANEHTADNEERREHELHYVKDAAARLKPIVSRAPDVRSRRLIEKAYDTVSLSPVKSNSYATQYEENIFDQIEVLEEAISRADNTVLSEIAERIIAIAEERNRVLMTKN